MGNLSCWDELSLLQQSCHSSVSARSTRQIHLGSAPACREGARRSSSPTSAAGTRTTTR